MTDLHTHILPGLDDGAEDPDTSLAMLREERAQGIDTVALTPHFYRDLETPEHFLQRRDHAMDSLRSAILSCDEDWPDLVLAAEVAWVPGMCAWPELRSLCYGDSSFLLIEPPVQPWSDSFFRELMDLMNRRGITPVIAHLDRYLGCQTARRLRELDGLRLPVQLSASALLGRATRRQALACLRSGSARLLISDCHNTDSRPPNLGPAMELLSRKFGSEAAALFQETDELLAPRWLDETSL